jgi:glycosyltransferase involved in cell wall biosynthesis
LNRNSANVKIVFGNGFPFGGASSKRCLHIAKGLKTNGLEVEVIVYRGTEKENSSENSSTEGNFEGINFRYLHKSTLWGKSKFEKIINLSGGIAKLLWYLHKENRKHKINSVVLYGSNLTILNLFLSLICRLRGMKFVFFLDEFPDHILYPKTSNNYSKFIFEKIFIKQFDVIAVISSALENYCVKLLPTNTKLILYHLTAEPPRTQNHELRTKNPELSTQNPEPRTKHHELRTKNIFYSGFSVVKKGNHTYYKDDLKTLLVAFAQFIHTYPKYKLVIAGQKDGQTMLLAQQLGLNENVSFVGKLSNDMYYEYIQSAWCLVLPRPKNQQTLGSMPLRLGEFMLSGNPVISSEVGEIKNYFTDSVEILLYQPDDSESLLEKFELLAIKDYLAVSIGNNGKKKAKEVFDIKGNASELAEIIANGKQK